MATAIEEANMFDNHPSLSASLEDFENDDRASPILHLPSHHSDFKTDESEAEHDSTSEGPWSPQGFRRPDNSSAWYQHRPYLTDHTRLLASISPRNSRESSSKFEDAEEDYTIPANVPLPRGSMSPEKRRSPTPLKPSEEQTKATASLEDTTEMTSDPSKNYIRLAFRAEILQTTEAFEAVITWARQCYKRNIDSKSQMAFSSIILFCSVFFLRLLIATPDPPPLPDLVKVAGFARNFEPLIYYSENGVRQIGDLQETGVAVWDLSESVRAANMTSAPVIVRELDELGDSLKKLSVELTKFFANVDGDIDGILLVMDWAKRELSALPGMPSNSLASAVTNINSLLSRFGIFENQATGDPTRVGALFSGLFGATYAQRTRKTLQRTFVELIGVLEESINSEILYATSLFSLFATIDRQFLNLQRTTIREYDTQERQEADFLSSLWTRLVGPDATQVRAYDKNKELLRSVRGRTLTNKNLLEEHNGKLMMLQQNLETLRRRLVSPLLTGGQGSSIGVDEQIRGLDGTYEYLKRVREKQKERVMESMYGGGKRASVRRIGGER